ncbi:MAG: CotH kinase family protein, partial [Bacteroidales bacterium]|nr:CotH kinase family protein [Bacteroidales bacterium]
GERFNLKATSLIINEDTLESVRIRTRGKSTLFMRRKSYSIILGSNATFYNGGEKEKFKKFYLLGLSMDKNYCSNCLAFRLMEHSGLFELFHSFCELRINGQSEGICMVVERPEDWALKKKDSPLLIRRGFNNEIEKLKSAGKTEKDVTKYYRNIFRQMYRALDRYEGEELYKLLSDWLDIDAYMKWLAFNLFIRNGDYTDEVFFFVDPATGKYDIIPWDYDDLFAKTPHEGKTDNLKSSEGRLIFSTEDKLDRKIVTDPYLYKMYLVQFAELMNDLSPDVLKQAVESTYSELYPYYTNYEIISTSKYDLRKETDLSELKSYLLKVYGQLAVYRTMYLRRIEESRE